MLTDPKKIFRYGALAISLVLILVAVSQNGFDHTTTNSQISSSTVTPLSRHHQHIRKLQGKKFVQESGFKINSKSNVKFNNGKSSSNDPFSPQYPLHRSKQPAPHYNSPSEEDSKQSNQNALSNIQQQNTRRDTPRVPEEEITTPQTLSAVSPPKPVPQISFAPKHSLVSHLAANKVYDLEFPTLTGNTTSSSRPGKVYYTIFGNDNDMLAFIFMCFDLIIVFFCLFVVCLGSQLIGRST